ncbi:hypothetical protein Pfo_006748, partial [Paulownia fortunei]
ISAFKFNALYPSIDKSALQFTVIFSGLLGFPLYSLPVDSSHSLYTHQSYASYNAQTQFNFLKNGSFPLPSAFKPHGSSSFDKKFQSWRTHLIRATASDSKTGRKQVEVVYDLEDKFNKLEDEVDRDAGMSRLTLFSPCKINVFLRITGKRAYGYHDLASLFHVISLGDKIKFTLSPSKSKDRLSANVSGVPLDERNLIIKALNLFRKKTGIDNYFWVHLDKKVPTGAGLGGGSSNAATALWAANQISGSVATEKDLQEWSSEIGSDIPFFFSHGAAYCTGRGEVVEDIPSPGLFDIPMVLIKPQEACPTDEVYKRLRLDQTSQIDPLTLLDKISRNGISQEVEDSMTQFSLSGSGSTIVGVGSPDPPQFVYDVDEYKHVFVSEANFITRSANQWYAEPLSTNAGTSPTRSSRSIE